MEHKLLYRQPAKEWIEALPLGNGRLGAMVFGGVREERLALNEDTLWSGTAKRLDEEASEYFLKARELALRDEYEAAQVELEKMTGDYCEAYMPMGNLRISFKAEGEASGYRRWLDLGNAVHETEFTISRHRYRTRCFISEVDQVLLWQMIDCDNNGINCRISMDSPLRSECHVIDGGIWMAGECPSHAEPQYVRAQQHIFYSDCQAERGLRFYAQCRIVETDGNVTASKGALTVEGASMATLLFAAHSEFAGCAMNPADSRRPYREETAAELERAAEQGSENLFLRHAAAHQALYGRTELSLGDEASDLPTDERLKRFMADPSDISLAALLFHYGRYLLIASSRPGCQPANLQGIWNHSVVPPWSCNFTTNINLEMNYWPALPCNLLETHEPLERFISEAALMGRETARRYYGAGGFVMHHNSDLWRHTNPTGRRTPGCGRHGCWPMAGGWLARHLFDRFLYTGDRTFLENTAWPVLREAAAFYLDCLVEDGTWTLSFVPSTSPENAFIFRGAVVSVCKTATMTNAILRELFTHVLMAAEILNLRDAFTARVSRALKRLPQYSVDAQGRLQEWNEPFEESERTHRHLSHLYPVYPGDEISPRRTPELALACKRALLARGDDGTGWSLAWKVNLWARLCDGDRAWKHIVKQLRYTRETDINNRHKGGGSYPNLLSAHPPFQIDGNLGVCAGIAEMLMHSEPGALELLPALPRAWPRGRIRGLLAIGNLEVDIQWCEGRLKKAHLRPKCNISIDIRYKDGVCREDLKAGEQRTLLLRDFPAANENQARAGQAEGGTGQPNPSNKG